MESQTEPKKMLACVFQGIEQLELVERDIPSVDPAAIVVKVTKVGICGSDLKTYQNGGFVLPGVVLGHEFSGTVVAVGSDVVNLSLGDRVTANPMPSLMGIYTDGAFAEYVTIANAELGQTVFRLPDNVSDSQGAMIEPLAVALRGVKQGHVTPESKVVILGLGTIGLCALLVLKHWGVKAIVGVDQPGARLELAKSLGAETHALGGGELNETIYRVFGEKPSSSRNAGVDFVFDASGNSKALNQAVGILRMGGELVVAGTYAGEASLDINQLVAKELKLLGTMAYEEEFAEACELIAGGINVAALISHQFPLLSVQQAFEQSLKGHEAVKVLLDVCSAGATKAIT